MTHQAGCHKATMELSLRNLQLLSYLRHPTDTHQLASSQGEADGVSERGYDVVGIGGVNSSCDWYRIRGQLPSTGGWDHTHTHETFEDVLLFLLGQFTPTQIKFAYTATISKLGESAPTFCNNFPNRKKNLIDSFTNLILDPLSIIGNDKKNMHR